MTLAANGFARPRDYPPRLLFRESISDYAIRDSLLRCSQFIRGRVLDVGCGHRPYKAVFQRQVESWVGVDWPDAGHRSNGSQGPEIIGDAIALPLREAAFDTVVCTQVLEHVSEPLRLFAEARRVLRPGGHLVLTAPQYNALHGEPRDFFRYTRYGLEHLAHKAGLVAQTVDPIGGFVALFAFVTGLHCAPLRLKPVSGLWQWGAWHLDRKFYRPKDCMGYVVVASKPHTP